MKKITFDFDNTMSREDVQEYAKKLKDKGYGIGIVTARYEDSLKHRYPFSRDNSDIYHVAKMLGIDRSDIKFTNKEFKANSLTSDVHFDDDIVELHNIRATKTKGINVNDIGWQQRADKLLGI